MFEEIAHFRHEHKYIESESSLIGIKSRLSALMQKDTHVKVSGSYAIRSLYFDDYRDRFLNESIDGVDERTKWRIRIYDRDASFISLERKMRKADLISKQSCPIDVDTYNALIKGICPIESANPPLLNLFIKEMKTTALHPAVIVEYDRIPLVAKSGNTRITIDRNIRSSDALDAFLSDGNLPSRPVLLSGQSLLEVKFDAFLPDHIAHAIEHGRMRRETFSKYYLARKLSFSGTASAQYLRRIQ